MKLSHLSRRRAAAPRRGRTLIVLSVLIGVALIGVAVLAGYLLGRDGEESRVLTAIPTQPAPARSEEAPEEAPAAVSERTPQAPASPEVVSPGDRPQQRERVARVTPEGTALPEDATAQRAQIQEHMEKRMERMRKLIRGENAEERLAMAKEILAEGEESGMVHRALDVLFELDPAAADAHLLAMLEGSADDASRAGADVMTASSIRSGARHEGSLSPDTLAALYEKGSAEIRLAAAEVSKQRGDASLLERFDAQLTEELASKDVEVRLAAVQSLSRRQGPTSTDTVIPLLGDDDERVRLAALEALARGRGDATTLKAIQGLADDPSERVSRRAQRMAESMERRMQLRQGLSR